MKICNNCSTENQIAIQKCVHCHMQGNFTFQEMPTEAPQISKDTVQCLNCASDNLGNGKKCIQCNFPIQRKIQTDNSISKFPIKSNLRVS